MWYTATTKKPKKTSTLNYDILASISESTTKALVCIFMSEDKKFKRENSLFIRRKSILEYRHWEKRVDNGSIGEARTKEFIIDRFWVLERSIDRDGADFLIQRKLTQISSIEPPRFGIIQSKFRENINGIINIKKDYVNDTFFYLFIQVLRMIKRCIF